MRAVVLGRQLDGGDSFTHEPALLARADVRAAKRLMETYSSTEPPRLASRLRSDPRVYRTIGC
jgi:hypothetical protein